MAYLEARAGIGRAGVTYAGFANPRFRIYIGGTDRTSAFVKDSSFVIQDALDDTPATLRARVKSVTEATTPTGDGLAGIYYDALTGTSPNIVIDTGSTSRSRTDTTINFSWGADVPIDGIGADSFGVVWTGYLKPRYSETYTIYIRSDDGSKFYIDTGSGLTSIVAGNWIDQAATERSATVALTAGQYYPIKVEYYDNALDATMQLSWSSASQTKEIIPQACLFTAQPAATTAWVPAVGQRIDVLNCTPDEYLFRGIILRSTARVQKGQPAFLDVEAIDARYFLDRDIPPRGRFAEMGVNTAVRRLLDNFTNTTDGLAPGYIPAALGVVPELRLDGSTRLSSVITRIARGVGAYWRLDARDRTLDIFTPGADDDSGNWPTLTNSTDIGELVYTRDASQLRNYTMVVGGGADVVSPTRATITSLTVSDLAWYGTADIRLGWVEDGYISFTTPGGSGQGTVTSIAGDLAGLPYDVPQGARLRVEAFHADTNARSLWAATMSLSSGTVYHRLETDATYTEAASLARADVEQFKTPLAALRFTTEARWVRCGQYFGSSITAPTSVVGTFLIQRVTTSPRIVNASIVSLTKVVEAGQFLFRPSTVIVEPFTPDSRRGGTRPR